MKLKTLTLKELGVEPLLKTYPNKKLQPKAMEAVSLFAVLKKTLKKTLSDTCSMHRLAARDASLQPWGYHFLLSQWSGRGGDEMEVRRHEVEVGREDVLRKRGNVNVADMLWWRRRANVSEL